MVVVVVPEFFFVFKWSFFSQETSRQRPCRSAPLFDKSMRSAAASFFIPSFFSASTHLECHAPRKKEREFCDFDHQGKSTIHTTSTRARTRQMRFFFLSLSLSLVTFGKFSKKRESATTVEHKWNLACNSEKKKQCSFRQQVQRADSPLLSLPRATKNMVESWVRHPPSSAAAAAAAAAVTTRTGTAAAPGDDRSRRRPLPPASYAVATAAARLRNGHVASGDATAETLPPPSPSAPLPSSGLERICEASGFEFFHWYGGGSTPLPLDDVEALVEEAWAHDYRKSNQARFVYTKEYLNWFTQGDCCDCLLVRTATTTPKQTTTTTTGSSGSNIGTTSRGGAAAAAAGGGGGGELVALLAVSKRMLFLASERRVLPIGYGTLMTVGPRHRKRKLAAALHDAVIDFLGSTYVGVTHYMGAFDGLQKDKSFEQGVYAEREGALLAASDSASAAAAAAASAAAAAAQARSTVISKTRMIPFWACTRDMAELLKYMPLSSELLTRVALSGPSRRLLEFSFREPAAAAANDTEKDYSVSLVEPRGITYPVPGAPETSGFVLNETIAALYGTKRTNVAGTYRVNFLKTNHFAEFLFIRHVDVKKGLEKERRSCAQIQIIDRGTTTRSELSRALQIVCNEFFEWKGSGGVEKSGERANNHLPCIGVLMQNWIGIPAVDLLRTRFLPSDRKIGFQMGRFAREGLGAPKLGDNLLFDLV